MAVSAGSTGHCYEICKSSTTVDNMESALLRGRQFVLKLRVNVKESCTSRAT